MQRLHLAIDVSEKTPEEALAIKNELVEHINETYGLGAGGVVVGLSETGEDNA